MYLELKKVANQTCKPCGCCGCECRGEGEKCSCCGCAC